MKTTPTAGNGPVGRYPFPRHYRLTRTDEFSSVFGFRRAIRGQFFMLHYQTRPNPDDAARLGLVVGKKYIRDAVDRNCVKRQARERFRLLHTSLQGYDLILRVIAKSTSINRFQVAAEIERLFAKLRPRAVIASRGDEAGE